MRRLSLCLFKLLPNYCADIWLRFAFVQPDRSSLWCIISALVGGAQRDESLNDCIGYNLKVTPHCPCCCSCYLISAQRAPMELVSWPYKNSARHDMCASSAALCLAASCRRCHRAAATAARSRVRCRWLKWTTDRFGHPNQAGRGRAAAAALHAGQ